MIKLQQKYKKVTLDFVIEDILKTWKKYRV